MLKALIVTIFALIGANAQAKYEIPDDKNVMIRFGGCGTEILPSNFQLFVWNIKKAEAKTEWARDFERFAPKSDVVLVQEAMMDDFMPSTVLRQKNFCWDLATSFTDNDIATGVMSGSPIVPLSIKFLRSPGREPLANTPKMTLITEYALANSRENLLTVNIHGLNFVTDKKNREQIEKVAAVLRTHKGPIIFAGDFNTWNRNRLLKLDEILSSLKMEKQPLSNDQRRLKLDHIYTRGLVATQASLHNDIESSDHKPITAEFRLK